MADDFYYLLTYWGTVVCSGGPHWMSHHALSSTDEHRKPIAFRNVNGFLVSTVDPQERFEYFRQSPYGPTSLRRNGLYLSAEDYALVSTSRHEPGDWELFVLLSSDDLPVLRSILENHWVDAASKDLIRSNDITLLSDFRLQLGSSTFSLLDNIPFNPVEHTPQPHQISGTTAVSNLVLWESRWKIHEYRLYKPLVFYCAFGEGALNLLTQSIRSLKKMTLDWPVDILVITSTSRAEVLEYCADWDERHLHVWRVHCTDFLDFCAARYRIFKWDMASEFQPLLYVDTDMAFDQNPDSMLLDIVMSPKMTAQEEVFADLGHWEPCGAQLFLETNMVVGGRKGFNSGAIGIPNIAAHAVTLGKIHRVIYGYADAKANRLALSHFDQAVANYVAVVTESFDLVNLTNRTRWFQHGRVLGGEAPRGLCHFWGAQEKREDMQSYVDTL